MGKTRKAHDLSDFQASSTPIDTSQVGLPKEWNGQVCPEEGMTRDLRQNVIFQPFSLRKQGPKEMSFVPPSFSRAGSQHASSERAVAGTMFRRGRFQGSNPLELTSGGSAYEARSWRRRDVPMLKI
jgi:hypothetical protein